ncbi:MAG: hypothetical protein ACPLW8_04490, partial [Candidatus Bathyarchaeales archaeon]
MFKKLLTVIFKALILLSIVKTAIVISAVEPGPGEGYARIYVNPQISTFTSPPTTVETTFVVHVRVYNYSQVAAWQVNLIYDARLLNITSATNVAYASDFIFPTGTYDPISASLGAW